MKIKHTLHCLFIAFILCHTTMWSQNDTIFYNRNWKKTTKAEALFYRPLPLEKKGEYSLIKDYYLDGTMQFQGWAKTNNLESTYNGKVIWYYPNGNKKSEINYENYKINGAEIDYYQDGTIKNEHQIVNNEIQSSKSYNAKGQLLSTMLYKDGSRHEGLTNCFMQYKNGRRAGKTLYYENTNKPAYISECSEEGCYTWKKETFYAINGDIIQENKTVDNRLEEGIKIDFFESRTCGYVKAIKSIKTYKDRILNGPYIRYNLNGDILYQGIYKGNVCHDGTFEKEDFNLVFISEYKNGSKNGTEIVLNDEKKIAEGIYKNDERQNGTFVEKKYFTDWSKTPIILNIVNGLEEGKQKYYNVARDITMGYYHAKKGKKDGDYAVFNYEGDLITEATYKNGKPYNGTILIDGKSRSYKNGERLREDLHVDLAEKKRLEAFSKGSDKIEGAYNMGGFEMAGSIVFLDTKQFFFSLSVGSLDIITYGTYHLKNGKAKLKIPEEQKQEYTLYGSKNATLKDTIQIRYYNYNARSKPLVQLNKQWYTIGELKPQVGRMRAESGIDTFKIAVKKLSTIKIGIKNKYNSNIDIMLKNTLEAKTVSGFNDFIIAYNPANKEITTFENATFKFKGETLINGDLEKRKKEINDQDREFVLDYIIENKSFPYYIRSKSFQKIKLESKQRTEKISSYLKLNKVE